MDSSSLVFLSFRKEDTGKTFVSHLYRSLDQKQIRTYKDEDQQAIDGRISPDVAKAITESDVAVVVISENYASSIWCLEVLAEITERSPFWMETIKIVFYEVDPGDLTRPTGKFADDLRRHEDRETPETVIRWRNALERLESTHPQFCSRNWEDDSKMLDDLIISISSHRLPIIRGRTSEENIPAGRSFRKQKTLHIDVEFHSINEIPVSHSKMLDPYSSMLDPYSSSDSRLMSYTSVKHIPQSSGSRETALSQDTSFTDDALSNESSPASNDSNGLVGMGRHKKTVYALLDLESKNSVRAVGIWGEDGVGKTTLAECVFDDISRQFQHHCFLSNVNNMYRNRISPSLLKHLTRKKSSDNIFDAIKPFLINRHVLLVIDGVHDTDDEKFKDAMKVTRWLGPGSRVIITTRFDLDLNSCGVKYTYQMESMRYEEALQLFSLCAFKMPYPLVGFEGFAIRAVHFAGRLPLALKVLGSFLYDKDEESWKRTLRKLEASQDNGSRLVSNYIGAREYLPRRQTELEQYVRADEEKHSSSYHMLL